MVSLKRQCRRLHRWLVPVTALPLLVIALSGVMLLLRREWTALQPPTFKGRQPGFSQAIGARLENLPKDFPDALNSLNEVKEIRLLPEQGVVKVQLKNHWELQLDSHSGDLLHKAYRWTPLLIAIHEGSFWSLRVTYLVFLPAAALFLILWGTGLGLFWRARKRAP